MIVFPNAKINLGLHILRRRPDGYHDLDTIMLPVDWRDILEVVPSDDGVDHLSVTGRAIACPPEKNLVMKALGYLREVAPVPPVRIALHKVIPDGAGLGGGSADAAFLISAAAELFSLRLDADRLAAVAARVGADCPLFIYNKPARCVGTGTTIAPLADPLPEGTWIAIHKPEVHVSTRDAYAAAIPVDGRPPLPSLLASTAPGGWMGRVVNDFERTVLPANPAIARAKERMLAAGAWYASMSGSGAAVYGLFSRRPEIADDERTRVCQLAL